MDNDVLIENIESAYENYCKLDPNVKKYVILPNGRKFYVLNMESSGTELIKLTGILKMNDDEIGEDSQVIIHYSQIYIIFERF